MSRPLLISSVALGLATAFLASSAAAHIRLLEPNPRYTGGNQLKSCPCGGTMGGDATCSAASAQSDPARNEASVNTFEAGSTITIHLEEYIGHTGRFRIAFDADGADQADFDANILLDQEDPNNAATMAEPAPWDFEITLPSEPCENCTLQIVQVMNGNANNPVPVISEARGDTYFICADLVLTAPGEGGEDPLPMGGTSAVDEMGAAGAGMDETGAAGAGMDETGAAGAGMDETGAAGTGMDETGAAGANDVGLVAAGAPVDMAAAGAAVVDVAPPAGAAGMAAGDVGAIPAAGSDRVAPAAGATPTGSVDMAGATNTPAAGSLGAAGSVAGLPLVMDDPGTDDGGCSVGRGSVGGVGALSFAFALALGLRRRRA